MWCTHTRASKNESVYVKGAAQPPGPALYASQTMSFHKVSQSHVCMSGKGERGFTGTHARAHARKQASRSTTGRAWGAPHHYEDEVLTWCKCPACSDKEDSVDAAIVLRVVGDLGILAPDNLAVLRHETELRDVDLEDGTWSERVVEVCE